MIRSTLIDGVPISERAALFRIQRSRSNERCVRGGHNATQRQRMHVEPKASIRGGDVRDQIDDRDGSRVGVQCIYTYKAAIHVVQWRMRNMKGGQTGHKRILRQGIENAKEKKVKGRRLGMQMRCDNEYDQIYYAAACNSMQIKPAAGCMQR